MERYAELVHTNNEKIINYKKTYNGRNHGIK